MNKTNNVNVQAIEATRKEGEADRSKLKRTQVIEGQWLLDESEGAQFRAEIPFEQGTAVFEADQPTFFGGQGRRPGPLHYCFYGAAACYAGVYANLASTMGIRLRKLGVRVEAKIDYSKVLGLADTPIVEEVRVTLTVRGDATKEKLEELENLANQRCPAAYALTHIVPLKSKVVVQEHVSREEVMNVLKCVCDPDYSDRSIVDMGLVKPEDIEVDGQSVKVTYGLSSPVCPFSAAIGLMIGRALERKLGVEAEVKLKAEHYQCEVVNEVLGDKDKSAELMKKMESYGILDRCVRC